MIPDVVSAAPAVEPVAIPPAAPAVQPVAIPPSAPRRERPRIQLGFYFATLTLAAGLGHPEGVLKLPVQFWLKDALHVSPQGLALFEAIACVPIYLAFLFGFLRDHWQPRRWRDRGYLVLASLAGIGCYTWLAAGELDYGRLLIAMLLAGVAFQLLHAAVEALMTAVAQQRFMTGRLSALSEFSEAAAGVLAAVAGGWLVTHASLRAIFLIAAGCTGLILAQGFWKPRAIFSSNRRFVAQKGVTSIGVLMRHPALKPTAVLILLWSFSPGYQTPLLYYLTDDVGISSTAYGICQAVDCIGITVASVLYIWLCQRVSLRRLLWWSIGLSVFPGLMFLLVRNATQAVAASFLLSLLIGFLNTSIGDLLMRASPEGLEGSYRMFGVSAFAVGGAIGDIFGSWVYESGGLIPCLIAEAVVTLCIFPALKRLPNAFVAGCESEAEQ